MRDEPLLVRLFAPVREALGSTAQLNAELNQSVVGSLAARRVTSAAALIIVLPMVFVLGVLALVALLTHVKLTHRFGPTAALVVEVVVVGALLAWAVIGFLRRRKPEAEPLHEELSLAPTEVEERLASGQLRPWDLVHDGMVWNTLDKSPQFEFASEEPAARERSRARRGVAIRLVGWLAGLGAYAWFLLSE